MNVTRRHVVLFCEDQGHEQLGRALIERLAREAGLSVSVDAPSARGGRGRAISELKIWQRALSLGRLAGTPDLLVVLIDGNCEGVNATRRQIEPQIDPAVCPTSVIGVPDPHVERWLMADAVAFTRLIGAPPPADPGKCGRDVYKKIIRETVERAGVPLLSDVLELAPDLVHDMDLFRAGKAQPALGQLIDDLQRALRALGA